jgi:hypothetical protein
MCTKTKGNNLSKYREAAVMGAGEIREAANLINRGNIFQEISEHFLRNTRITIFIPFERSKHMGLRKKINFEWEKV